MLTGGRPDAGLLVRRLSCDSLDLHQRSNWMSANETGDGLAQRVGILQRQHVVRIRDQCDFCVRQEPRRGLGDLLTEQPERPTVNSGSPFPRSEYSIAAPATIAVLIVSEPVLTLGLQQSRPDSAWLVVKDSIRKPSPERTTVEQDPCCSARSIPFISRELRLGARLGVYEITTAMGAR